MTILSGEEEKVRCDLLTLFKYGINFSEKKYHLFSNHIIERIIGRLSDLRGLKRISLLWKRLGIRVFSQPNPWHPSLHSFKLTLELGFRVS